MKSLNSLVLTRNGRARVSVAALDKAMVGTRVFREDRQSPRTRLTVLRFLCALTSSELLYRFFRKRDRNATDKLLSVCRMAAERLTEALPGYVVRNAKLIDDTVIRDIARTIAAGCHVAGHRAFDEGLRDNPSSRVTPALMRSVRDEEAEYRRLLRRSRTIAGSGDIDALNILLINVVDRAHSKIPRLCHRAGRVADSTNKNAAGIGIRTCTLARKYAMLAAAVVLLHRRLLWSRTHDSTGDIAAKRIRLLRDDLKFDLARRTVGGLQIGTEATVIGKTRQIQWQERARRPFSVATLEDGETSMLIPYKSMRHQGVAKGVNVCARGRIETDDAGSNFLKIEFEGPGQHARTVWEDWLADSCRDVYDLYPGVMFMAWEFAPLRGGAAGIDLYARMGRREED